MMLSSSRINAIVKGIADELDTTRPLTFLSRTPATIHNIKEAPTDVLDIIEIQRVLEDSPLITWIESK